MLHLRPESKVWKRRLHVCVQSKSYENGSIQSPNLTQVPKDWQYLLESNSTFVQTMFHSWAIWNTLTLFISHEPDVGAAISPILKIGWRSELYPRTASRAWRESGCLDR